MSDGVVILTYYGYFLGCLRLCLTRSSKAKGAEGSLAAGSIGRIFTRITSVWGVSTGAILAWATSAWGTYIDVGLSDISY